MKRLAVAVFLIVSAATPALAADGSAPKGSEEAFTVTNPVIDESSGLATSTQHDDTYYTVNDSGGGAQIYVLDGQGETEATLTMRLINPIDWEAIAPGPAARIWVGDIGDNDTVREKITLYRFIEPESLYDQNLTYGSYDFVYPDGAHDAEALLVHPDTGRVYIITKGLSGGTIYEGPEDPGSDGLNELTKIGEAPSTITDGAFLPDGSGMMIRSYSRAYLLDWPTLKERRQLALPSQEMGESLAMTSSGKRLLVGAEGNNSKVWSVPADGPPPEGSASPKPPKQDDPAAANDDGEDQSTAGAGAFAGMPGWIWFAVIGVALAAGVAAFPPKRRRRPARARVDEDPWSDPWGSQRPPGRH